ncbi:MAG TPA: ATP-binding cassette domain-containing protein [Polyangia bacterium]
MSAPASTPEPPPPPALVQLEAVSKRFGDVAALDAVTLDVAAGRTTALLGPSGCGKTTCLRLMLGLVRPDDGRVSFRGAPLPPDGAALRAVRARMGYVVQDGGLFPHLTAVDNVRLMARTSGWTAERMRARVAELAALVRLPESTLARHPGELSGGQKQRVALMRALMLDPELLFLDEPLGALDPLVRAELQHDLTEIFARLEKTVVLVTHDLAEAVRLAHQLVLLSEGRIVQQGSASELAARPATSFVTAFLRAQRAVPWAAGDGGAPPEGITPR